MGYQLSFILYSREEARQKLTPKAVSQEGNDQNYTADSSAKAVALTPSCIWRIVFRLFLFPENEIPWRNVNLTSKTDKDCADGISFIQ